jgi:ferric-dicitrate binding protein FerR (iron transport regulator)
LSNEATSKEIESLLDWVSIDNKNLKFFNERVNAWSQRTQNETYDVNAALRRFNNRIDHLEDKNRERSFSWSWIGIAASLAFLMLVGAGFYLWNDQTTVTPLASLTATMKRDTLALSDGSVIYLNKNSTIEYPQSFAGKTREVFLTGEAFFKVQRNPAMPFIIHTGNIQTEVLGTSFNINTTNGAIAVVVETGRVGVASSTFKEILDPTDKLVYNKQTERVERTTADLDNELAWRYNTIIFDDAKLSEVAGKLGSHFNVKFMFENEKLKNCRITGRYKNESLDTILHAIEFSTDVRFDKRGDSIHVAGNGCDKTN